MNNQADIIDTGVNCRCGKKTVGRDFNFGDQPIILQQAEEWIVILLWRSLYFIAILRHSECVEQYLTRLSMSPPL